MYLNINYPAGVALVANILAIVCHIVQFVIYVRYQNPNNWTSSIPAKYIMTFVSGVDSCLTAYYFIRARYMIKKKGIIIIIITVAINAVTIVLNSIGDQMEPWINGQTYLGGMFYSQCGSLRDSYSKLRCELIDATYVALIVSIIAWVIAIFGQKPPIKTKSDVERPSMKTVDRTSTSLNTTTEKRTSSKPPKQMPVVSRTEENVITRSSTSNETTKLLMTTSKARQNTLSDASEIEKKVVKKSSTEHLPLSIHDASIKPLKALDNTKEVPLKYGRRVSTMPEQSPTLTKIDSSSSIHKDHINLNE